MYVFNILLGVGKTCVLQQFVRNRFIPGINTTVGVDTRIKTVDTEYGQINIIVDDTTGQERFISVTRSYYKSAIGIYMIYDITE